MKHKREIKTRHIYKCKAMINIHSGQKEYGRNYTKTYSPVVTWFYTRLLSILSVINQWHTQKVDFVIAYPQSPIDKDLYMRLIKGIYTKT